MNKSEIKTLIDKKIEDAGEKYNPEIKFLMMEIVGLSKMYYESDIEEDKEILLSDWDKHYCEPSKGAMQMLHHRRKQNRFEEFHVTDYRQNRVIVNVNNYFKWREATKKVRVKVNCLERLGL